MANCGSTKLCVFPFLLLWMIVIHTHRYEDVLNFDLQIQARMPNHGLTKRSKLIIIIIIIITINCYYAHMQIQRCAALGFTMGAFLFQTKAWQHDQNLSSSLLLLRTQKIWRCAALGLLKAVSWHQTTARWNYSYPHQYHYY